jgi:myo-inositol-1(or 4)-monophosphatase
VGAATAPDQLSQPPAGDLLALARRLAQAAREVLRARPADLGVTTKSSPTDVVTVMDRAAERVILDGLAADRPDDAVVSEESSARDGSTGVRWFVDPLDGTVNYTYGLPYYSVSIAAEVAGEMVCGVVLDVERGVEYTATRGGGAARDGLPISCSRQTEPALALVATGFSYQAARRAAQARSMVTVLPAIRDIRRFGSAALDLCAVACGAVDAYFEAGMHEWDWAAGALIAREAGARVDGLQGRPPGPQTTLAANPELFDLLHHVLVASHADGADDEESAGG